MTETEMRALFTAYLHAGITGSVGATFDDGRGTVMSWFRYVMPVPKDPEISFP